MLLRSVLVSLLLLVPLTEAGAHQPHDDVKTAVVSPAYDADQTVFASISFQLVKSTDRGATWSPSDQGQPHGQVSSIAMSPAFAQDASIFVGINATAADGHVYATSDGGATWAAADAGLPGSRVLSMAISPEFATDQTVFAGTEDDGLFQSTDAGASWVSLNPGATDRDIQAIALAPSFPADPTLFVATNNGLLKSTNGGQTWFPSFPQGLVLGLAISPAFAQDQTLFIGISGVGVLRSQNAGSTWSLVNSGLAETSVNGVAVSPDYANDQTLLVGTDNGVFRSTNRGNSWTLETQGLPRPSSQSSVHYYGFSFSRTYATDRTVFLASFDGLQRTEDGADTWRQLDVASQKRLRGLAVSPAFAEDGTVYAGTYGGGIYRTVDGGESWGGAHTGLSTMFTQPLVVSPEFETDDTVFLGYLGNVARTRNRGDRWVDVPVAAAGFLTTRAIAVSPDFAADRTVFIADDASGDVSLYKSTDGGDAYFPLNAPVEGVQAIAISSNYSSDQTLFASGVQGQQGAGIYRSQDGGTSWSLVRSILWAFSFALSPAFGTDGTIYAGTLAEGILRSTDGGDTWLASNGGLPEVITVESIALAPDFPADPTMFAGTRNRGVYRSTDAGASWSHAGIPANQVTTLAFSPDFATDATVYAGAWEGAYRSTDGGNSWQRVLNIRRYDNMSEYIAYVDDWVRIDCPLCSSTSLHMGYRPLARATLTFVGDEVTWIGERLAAGGIANVHVDGALETTVDLYSPVFELQQSLFNRSGFGPGEHELAIEVSGTKNPASAGFLVPVDAFQIGY